MKGAGSGNYYLGLAREDYYQDRAEPPGQWFGTGAALLNLPGIVQRTQLHSLLEGFTPDGKRALVQNAGRPNRQSGWDLTFSAPKSVSVLWALSPENIRKEIELAHQDAVVAALSHIEKTAGITRRGQGGATKEPAALMFATFQHSTSRDQDPQLHTHAILINLGLRQDGTTGSLQSLNVFREKMAAGAVYQSEFASALEQRLHLSIEPETVGFHIRGVPKELCREFSKRRQTIERVLKERGNDNAVAAKVAALDTRKTKKQVSRDELISRWRKVGESFGWDTRQLFPDAKQEEQVLQDAEKQSDTHKETPPNSASKQEDRRVANPSVSKQQIAREDVKTQSTGKKLEKAANQGWLRYEWRPLFPRAPFWSPARKWKAPVIVIGPPRQPRRYWGHIIWSKITPMGELRVQKKLLFPYAPWWSPARQLELPALRLVEKPIGSAILTPSKDNEITH